MTAKVSRALFKTSKNGEKTFVLPARTATPAIEKNAKAPAQQGNGGRSKIRFEYNSRGIVAPLADQTDYEGSQHHLASMSWQEGGFVRREAVSGPIGRAKPKFEYQAPEDLHPPLHLLRAMLREAGYLPDPVARRYFHTYIIHRFRVHASYGTAWPRPGTEESERARRIGKSRLTKHLREARKGLKLLVNASHGSQSPLRKALEMAYGRRGVRKHELLKDLMPQRTIPENETALEELAHAIESDRATPSSKTPELSEKLLALVKSQKGQQDRMFSKNNIKSTKPVIPETNAWGRPFPKRREKNVTKRWYRETLERVMPPLPKRDWQQLRDLAVGQGNWVGPPKRRALEPLGEIDEEKQQEWHQITPRFMRRMWQAVYQQCPLLERDSTRSRWFVTWGHVTDSSSLSLQPGRSTPEGAFEDHRLTTKDD